MSDEPNRRRSLAFHVLCLGVLMIVLDTTIVVVAVPSMLADLRLSDTSVTWLVNAYTLTFAGFLLLGGRLGDLYGARRLFLIGIGVFTLASLACGLAHTLAELLAARAAQGVGGAIVTAVSLSLILNLFTTATSRAKAVGFYAFVSAAGGAVGELLGGVLTSTLGWHWIFFVNVPLGGAVYAFCAVLLPRDAPVQKDRHIDVMGGVTITGALTLFAYTFVNGKHAGWISAQTQVSFGAAVALLLLFVVVELRSTQPLVPFRQFRLHNFAVANIVGVLWAGGSFAWFVISALYMQRVLGYNPLRVGLAFVPAELIMAAFSTGLSAKTVARFGVRVPLWTGMVLAAGGLALFARAPSQGSFILDVLPGMVLLGLGAGITSSPLLLAATGEVESTESGLASGMVNTSFMMGGAMGLALLVTVADVQTGRLLHSGFDFTAALNGGYHLAFIVGAFLAATAGILGAVGLREATPVEKSESLIAS